MPSEASFDSDDQVPSLLPKAAIDKSRAMV
jgi:hypothetical protein